MSTVAFARIETTVKLTVHDPAVITRVTGPGGDEWRSRFYQLHTFGDVIEHLAFNYVSAGVDDISRLDGWGDCDPLAVSFEHEDTETESWS